MNPSLAMLKHFAYSWVIADGSDQKVSIARKSFWALHNLNARVRIHKGSVSSRAEQVGGENNGKGSHNRRRRIKISNAFDAQQEHYTVLGLPMGATSIDIKRAFRHLARQYHPDVNKEPDAGDSFKSIRLAYEVLSNDSTRTEYDNALRLQELVRNYRWRNWSESELTGERRYSWVELNRRARQGNWERHKEDSKSSFSSNEEDFVEEKMKEREPVEEWLKHVLFIIFSFQTFGAHVALTLCGFCAILNRGRPPGYKLAHMIAWLIGGHRGILLILGLSFISWYCGNSCDSLVALIALAIWMGVELVRFAPIPQGAILAMTYMCFKLQLELS